MKLLRLVFILVGSFAVSNSVIAAHRECPTWTLEDDFSRSAAVFVGWLRRSESRPVRRSESRPLEGRSFYVF